MAPRRISGRGDNDHRGKPLAANGRGQEWVAHVLLRGTDVLTAERRSEPGMQREQARTEANAWAG
jgi:hypothetical protein